MDRFETSGVSFPVEPECGAFPAKSLAPYHAIHPLPEGSVPRVAAGLVSKDPGRGILTFRKHEVPGEYRLHENFNLSTGRLWDVRVNQL